MLKMTGYGFVFILVALSVTLSDCQQLDYDTINKIYQHNLASKLGNGTVRELEKYFSKHLLKVPTNTSLDDCFEASSGVGPVIIKEKCLLRKCLSPEEVLKLTGLDNNSNNNNASISMLATILLHLRDNDVCDDQTPSQHSHKHTPPSSAEVWGYGILCTTVISVCALGGLIALPFVHKTIYNKILIYMVGLAVGTLVGSSLLFLLPEALELTEQELNEHNFVWKCLVAMGGIYVFFNIERVLKIITESQETSDQDKKKHHEMHAGTFATFHEAEPESMYRKTDTLPHVSPCSGDTDSKTSDNDDSMHSLMEKDRSHENGNGRAHMVSHKHSHTHVAPVAWMIIFGDGLHNFIDGVSIGAAFTESILAGVSVSVAILCEELPHELGDFAVLLNAGMKIKRAVCYNFLSACMCYLGLVVGIFLGENTASHVWVFAFAAGMFLYIALVDMMPEMNAAAELEENIRTIGKSQIYLLQNFGLLTGYGIMLVMAIYGGNIEEAIKGHS